MKNKKGFTLVELLVVIAIIGILSTVAVVNLNTARTKAKIRSLEASAVVAMKAFSVCISEGETVYYDGTNSASAGPGYQDIVPGTQMCSNWPDIAWPTVEGLDEYMTNYDWYSGVFKLSFEMQIDNVALVTCIEDTGCTTTTL